MSGRAAPGLVDMAPGIIAALSFSITDILLKLLYASGMDVMSLLTVRGVLVTVFFGIWLKLQPPPVWHSRRQAWVAVGLGVLFAGTMFGLLKSIDMLPVSVAILAYFIYPLLTGIGGALTGLDRLGWRAAVAALAAFGGLALMLGVNLHNLSLAGLGFAFGAAVCRVFNLLGTRAYLMGTDARVTMWYALLPSTAIYIAASAAIGVVNFPLGAVGWWSFIGISIGSTLSSLLIYISTNRVGPFRTAFVMNLEPLVTAILSMWLLEEYMTPMQMLGAAIMIGALCAFQFARR